MAAKRKQINCLVDGYKHDCYLVYSDIDKHHAANMTSEEEGLLKNMAEAASFQAHLYRTMHE